MKKIFFSFFSVLIFTIVSGCCSCLDCRSEKKTASEKLNLISEWIIEDLPSATAKKIKPAPNAAITFQQGKVSGCAGDNRFFGNVKFEGGKLTFSHMGMTRMMGPNAAYEGLFMESLNQVAQAAVIKGKMCLQSKDGKTLMVLKPKQKKK